MKNLCKFSVLLLAAGLVFGLAGCPTDPDDGGGGVSFQNFAPPSIRVENLTGERLVAFKGSLSPNTLISGIPAYAANHGLRKDAELFNTTGAFIMLLLTESQYKANKNNLGALNNQVFARIYAFYNHTATNNNVFQISSKIGGEGRLTIINPTNYNVEIRKDGITGEILGFAAAQMTSGNIIYLHAPESYDIYPVFKFYSPVDKEFFSVVPKYTTSSNPNLIGKPYMETYGFAGNELIHTLDLANIENQGDFNLSSGSVYLRITNSSSSGIRIWDGTQPVITSLGIDVLNANQTETFTLHFNKNVDGSYPDSQNFAQLYIGTTQNRLQVPTQSYQLDYIYTIEVTGNTGALLTLQPVQQSNKVNLNQIFGLNY